MPIPNVSSLYQRIQKGSEGAQEFARIIAHLLISDSNREGYQFLTYSDAAGDYKGVDGIISKGLTKIGVQYKFFPAPFSSDHKAKIKASLKKAIADFWDMEEWVLIIPEDPNRHDLAWLESISTELNMQVTLWGHTRIINLMLKDKEIRDEYYPELNQKSVRYLSNEPTEEDINSYFGKFLDPDADLSILFLKAQPTIGDCKSIFTKEYYKEISDVYYLQYRELFDVPDNMNNLKSRQEFEIKSSTYSDIVNRKHLLPGGMHMMLEKYNSLNPGTKFYRVVFKEKGAELGISFNVWCFLNSRWVFFPKPFRVVESIESMRKDKYLNRMVRILRFFGMHKTLQKEYKSKSILATNHIIYKLLNERK